SAIIQLWAAADFVCASPGGLTSAATPSVPPRFGVWAAAGCASGGTASPSSARPLASRNARRVWPGWSWIGWAVRSVMPPSRAFRAGELMRRDPPLAAGRIRRAATPCHTPSTHAMASSVGYNRATTRPGGTTAHDRSPTDPAAVSLDRRPRPARRRRGARGGDLRRDLRRELEEVPRRRVRESDGGHREVRAR